MAAGRTLAVDGYRDLLRALDRRPRNPARGPRHAPARRRRDPAPPPSGACPPSTRSAAGYKVRVRQRGVAVEQSLKRTTGLHPEWGAYQMRHALLPALDETAPETDRRMELALDAVAAHFNTAGACEWMS
jgi:hypothetical protein